MAGLISSLIRQGVGGSLSGSPLTNSSSFSIPASGSNVTVTVGSVEWLFPGMNVIITDNTQFMSGVIVAVTTTGVQTISVRNTAAAGGAITGTMSAGSVVSAGVI